MAKQLRPTRTLLSLPTLAWKIFIQLIQFKAEETAPLRTQGKVASISPDKLKEENAEFHTRTHCLAVAVSEVFTLAMYTHIRK